MEKPIYSRKFGGEYFSLHLVYLGRDLVSLLQVSTWLSNGIHQPGNENIQALKQHYTDWEGRPADSFMIRFNKDKPVMEIDIIRTAHDASFQHITNGPQDYRLYFIKNNDHHDSNNIHKNSLRLAINYLFRKRDALQVFVVVSPADGELAAKAGFEYLGNAGEESGQLQVYRMTLAQFRES